MSLEKFLEAIQPGLTLYGVLLTFGLSAFFAARFLWQYEKKLREECIELVRDLLDDFRGRCAVPVLRNELAKAMSAAYERAISSLSADLYEDKVGAEGKPVRALIPDETLRQVVSESALADRLATLKSRAEPIDKSTDPIEKFLSSATGSELFDRLDRVHEECAGIRQDYRKAFIAATKAAYSLFGLAIVLLAGMAQIVEEWAVLCRCLWVITAIELLACALYSTARMEYFRRKLLRKWEDMQIHGTV